jgi:hypothetical protein
MKPVSTLCGQNAKLLIVNAGGTYSYRLWRVTIVIMNFNMETPDLRN